MTYIVHKKVKSRKLLEWRESSSPKLRGYGNLSLKPQHKPVMTIWEDTLPNLSSLVKIIKKEFGSGIYRVWNPHYKTDEIGNLVIH